MPLTNFQNGVASFGIPLTGGETRTGNAFFVDSNTGVNGDGHTGTDPTEAFDSIDYAIGRCTANNGDVIYAMEGHAETISAAAGIALDVAGVSIIGLGVGATRPIITFSAAGSTFAISANNTKVLNIIGRPSIDAVTNAFNVTGNDCELDIEWQDASASIEAETVIRLDTADNANVNLRVLGFTAGNAMIRCIAVDDSDNVRIQIDAYGVVSTAWVNMVDASSLNLRVDGRLYTQGITNFSRDVVDTIGSSTWSADIYDASAGLKVSGGSAGALASDDVSGLAAAIDAVDNLLDTEFPVVVTAVGAVADAALADTIEGAAASTQSILTDLKGVLQRIGADNANNTSATTSVVANRDGSVLERLEQLEATIQKTISKVQTTPSGGTDALFTITGGPIHIVSIWGIVTTVLVNAANGTLQATSTVPASTTALSTTVAIDNDAAGTTYTFVGPTGVLTPTTAGVVLIDMGSVTLTETQYIVPIGNINFLTSAAMTGVITWYMSYIPSPGAVVVAA